MGYDMDDIVEVKNRQKKMRRRGKFLIFLLLVGIGVLLYQNREKWLPRLKGIGKTYETIVNDGKLAEGNFPIETLSETGTQIEFSGKTLFLLNEANLYLYNEQGGLEDSRQHAYSNAIMKVANETALIYESGGQRFRVEGKRKLIYEECAAHPIIFARLNNNGYTAVVTISEKYLSALFVYNEKGKLIYSRECVERIADFSFTDGSDAAMLSFLAERDGELITEFERITFATSVPQKKSAPLTSFCLKTDIYSSGAVIIGDTAIAYYNTSGETIGKYVYDGEITGCDSNGEKVAVILSDNARRKYKLVFMADASSETFEILSDDEYRSVIIYDGMVYAMSKLKIEAYDFKGKLRSTVNISDSYSEFRRCENYIFLKNYRRIDRIDYDS